MRILIFGATGGTGRHVVAQGLQERFHITAFVRNPAGVTAKNKNLSIFQGSITNPEDIEKALKGQDVVISVLGNKTRDTLSKPNHSISDGVKNILLGMKKRKVKRLLFVASFGVNENIFFPEKLLLRTILKNLFADIPLQEKLIKKSGLDWTIVHPARLIDIPKTERYNRGEELSIGPFSKIARSDVADFLLKSITDKATIGKTMTISY